MSILNVNTIQPVGSAQTITVSATDLKIGSTTLSSGGAVTISAGSTSAPSVSPSGDSNTGIFFPSPDTVCIGEGGVEVIRVDSSGRVGVGTNRLSRPFEVWAGTAGTSFSVDSSGRVQSPFQPTFCGISTYGSAFTGTTLTPMIFGGGVNTYVNQGSHYNTSTGVFTCPIDGNYQVHVQGHLQEQSGYTTIRIRRNSTVRSNAWQGNSGAGQGGGGSLVSGVILSCSANDTIDITFETNRSANYIWESYWLLHITLIG